MCRAAIHLGYPPEVAVLNRYDKGKVGGLAVRHKLHLAPSAAQLWAVPRSVPGSSPFIRYDEPLLPGLEPFRGALVSQAACEALPPSFCIARADRPDPGRRLRAASEVRPADHPLDGPRVGR